MAKKRIAITTGGGDAPGLNAVIRAIVLTSLNRDWECYGIREGYNGLLQPELYPQGGLIPLGRESVRGITHLGGTILGTTNRGNPLRYPTVDEDGQLYEKDRTDELLAAFEEPSTTTWTKRSSPLVLTRPSILPRNVWTGCMLRPRRTGGSWSSR
jgi:hypothetical protein